MLQVNLEHILNLKDLSHPRRADILERSSFVFMVMQLHFPFTSVFSHYSGGLAIHNITDGFIATVLLQLGDQKLIVLLFSLLSVTTWLLHSL